jgi:peptidoglycan/LPS O-acetylase OafA/YrhL
MPSLRRIDNFSTIRLGLALIVIWSHSFWLTKLSQATEPVFWFTRGQLDGGTWAVHCFLNISGFLVCGSWFKSGSFKEYLMRRIRRIYPGFITAILVSAFVFGPLGGVVLPDQTVFTWIFRAITLQDPQIPCPAFCSKNPYMGMINGSLWTIRYEEFMYAILAIMGLLKLVKVPVAVAIFVIFTFGLCPGGEIFNRLGSHFFAGVLFYLFLQKIRFTPKLIVLALLAIVVASVSGRCLNLILPLPGTYLLLALALNKKLELNKLVFFTKYSDLSYGVYLYAFPIQQLFFKSGITDPNVLTLVSSPVSMLCALASWHLIEKPFMMKGRDRNDLSVISAPEPEKTGVSEISEVSEVSELPKEQESSKEPEETKEAPIKS